MVARGMGVARRKNLAGEMQLSLARALGSALSSEPMDDVSEGSLSG